MKKETSWGEFANWYDELLKEEGTYQKELILPNLLRLLEIKKGELVVDLACGQGFFAREFQKTGARVVGVDISKELIEIAKKNSPKEIEFKISGAHNLSFLSDKSAEAIVIVLAIQNILNVQMVFEECARVLKDSGRLAIVMTHPAFRVFKASSWGWDPLTELTAGEKGVMYRRIDTYLSESKDKIQMHPGDNPGAYTLSFHRPLQYYFKALNKAGFSVGKLEEWNSHKKSQPGPRAKAEDKARKEIPLFLFLEAAKEKAR